MGDLQAHIPSAAGAAADRQLAGLAASSWHGGVESRLSEKEIEEGEEEGEREGGERGISRPPVQ